MPSSNQSVVRWTNARACREFSPYISNPAVVTKILKGDQSLPFQVILLMAIRFNAPLDEILLGEKSPPFADRSRAESHSLPRRTHQKLFREQGLIL